MRDDYCTNCRKDVPIRIRSKTVTLKYRTRMITYDELYAVCQFCGDEVHDPNVENMNAERRAHALSFASHEIF
jgi:YgiT-type zinc finger domain-containing protein